MNKQALTKPAIGVLVGASLALAAKSVIMAASSPNAFASAAARPSCARSVASLPCACISRRSAKKRPNASSAGTNCSSALRSDRGA